MAPTCTIMDKGFFLWNNPAVAKLELDKNRVLAETMGMLERPEDSIQWSL